MRNIKNVKYALMFIFCLSALLVFMPAKFSSLTKASPDKAKQSKPAPPVDVTQYVGSDSCAQCHNNEAAHYSVTAHRKTNNENFPVDQRGCEACHGGAKKHVEFHRAAMKLYEDGKPEE